jgi:hypothetical protein
MPAASYLVSVRRLIGGIRGQLRGTVIVLLYDTLSQAETNRLGFATRALCSRKQGESALARSRRGVPGGDLG